MAGPSKLSVVFPASYGQQQLWILDQVERAGAAYNVPVFIRVTQTLEHDLLARAFSGLVARHEILRTTFGVHDGDVQQTVRDPEPPPIHQVDLRSLPSQLREDEWRRQATADVARPFDLTTGPLVRLTWFILEDSSHLLLFTLHHITFDGWSVPILVRDFAALYRTAGVDTGLLPELPIQYADFAAWQRELHAPGTASTGLAFWVEALAGAPAHTSVPTDYQPDPDRRFSGRSYTVDVESRTAPAIRSIAQRAATTPFVLLLAVFAGVIGRYVGRNDVVIATVAAGRTQPELAELIGFFVNTVLIRVAFEDTSTGADLLEETRRRVAAAFEHQACPFNHVLEATRTPEGPRTLQLMFTAERIDRGSSNDQWQYVPVELPHTTSKFDFAVNVVDDGDRMRIVAEYNDGLFDEGSVQSVLHAYRQGLESFVKRPDKAVSDWSIVPEPERVRLLEDWSGRSVSAASNDRIDDLIDRMTEAAPHAIAIVSDAQAISYQELRTWSDELSTRLGAEAAPGDIVGVAVDRSADYICALLGIMKAQCAYLPIDTTMPPARIAFILRDAAVRVIVGRRERSTDFGSQLVWIDPARRPASSQHHVRPASAEDVAYVMYTSGSTGVPKGVAIEHRNVCAFVRGPNYAELGPDQRILHVASGAFDAATFEIWGALANGGTLVISPTSRPTVQQLAEMIRVHRITTMLLTTTFFNTVIDVAPTTLAPIRQLIVGGEAMSATHVRRAQAALPDTAIINAYGPTEATVAACTHRISRPFAERMRSVPIGRAVQGSHLYLLDRKGHLAPQGAPAELYIGGAGVGRGYVNRTDETAAAFRTGVVPWLPHERTYRTGDLVRWRSDGTLEFLGRVDHQVKIRGFRIELSEIESVLREHPDVLDAAATVAGTGDRARIIAHIVTAGAASVPASLSDHLRARLPDYMVPTSLVPLRALPRTENGKLDRAALPAPPKERSTGTAEPHTDSERRLVRILEPLLGVERIYVTDDFFHLGGHSLLAIRLFSEIEREFGTQVPLHVLGKASTVRALAVEIDRQIQPQAGVPGIVPLRDGGTNANVYVPFSVGGDLLFCSSLVAGLSTHCPVWGLTPPDGIDQADLQALAKAMAGRVLAHSPDREIVLVGYSFSGMLAYEIAVEIQQLGRRIALLAVIDSGPAVPPLLRDAALRPLRILANVPNWLRDDLGESSPRAAIARLRRKVTAWRSRGSRLLTGARRDEASALFEDMYGGQAVAKEYRRDVEEHFRALLSHTPRRYRGPLLVFRARTRPLFHSLEPDLGWRRWVDGTVEIVKVSCTHDNILRHPHVDAIARHVNSRLTPE